MFLLHNLHYVIGLLSVSVSPSEYTATVGESSLTIECTISGEPEAVTWYWKKSPLDGTPSTIISRGVNNQIHQVAESTTNPHLTIKNIVKDDAADYECYAVNIAGTSSSNAKVRIYVKGNFKLFKKKINYRLNKCILLEIC